MQALDNNKSSDAENHWGHSVAFYDCDNVEQPTVRSLTDQGQKFFCHQNGRHGDNREYTNISCDYYKAVNQEHRVNFTKLGCIFIIIIFLF